MVSSAKSQLREKSGSIEFYEERYEKGYMADHGDLEQWPLDKKERVFGFIRELGLPATGRAVDVGCGSGIFTSVLKQALPGWEVWGTDISSTAVANASACYSDCSFFVAGDSAAPREKFDLVFSHHVLEHVFNLKMFLDEINVYLKPSAGMIHILPCGNEGSFEDNLSRLVKGGIDDRAENRRYFEEPAHLRRLTTEQLTGHLDRYGFRLKVENYHNHYWSGIRWITEAPREDIRAITDPALAIDDSGREQLAEHRQTLLRLAYLRLPVLTHRALAKRQKKTLKEIIKYAGATILLPLARLVDRGIREKAINEWNARRTDRRGGEMYLYFTREM